MSIVDNNNAPLAHGYVLDPEFNFDWDDIDLQAHIVPGDRHAIRWPVIVLRSVADAAGGRTKIDYDHFVKLSVISLFMHAMHIMRTLHNVYDPQGDLVDQEDSNDITYDTPSKPITVGTIVTWITDVVPEEDSKNYRAIAIYRDWVVPRIRVNKAQKKKRS